MSSLKEVLSRSLLGIRPDHAATPDARRAPEERPTASLARLPHTLATGLSNVASGLAGSRAITIRTLSVSQRSRRVPRLHGLPHSICRIFKPERIDGQDRPRLARQARALALGAARNRRILLQRKVRTALVVILFVRAEQMMEMLLAKDHHGPREILGRPTRRPDFQRNMLGIQHDANALPSPAARSSARPALWGPSDKARQKGDRPY
jgi:hypothetical protein